MGFLFIHKDVWKLILNKYLDELDHVMLEIAMFPKLEEKHKHRWELSSWCIQNDYLELLQYLYSHGFAMCDVLDLAVEYDRVDILEWCSKGHIDNNIIPNIRRNFTLTQKGVLAWLFKKIHSLQHRTQIVKYYEMYNILKKGNEQVWDWLFEQNLLNANDISDICLAFPRFVSFITWSKFLFH